MKLSWEQVRFTLSMNWQNFISDLKLIPFTIRLKWICWKKGGGKNVTAEDIKDLPIAEGGENEAAALLRIVAVHDMCNYLYDFFKVDKDNQNVKIYIVHHAYGKIDDVELDKDIGDLVNADDVRAKIYGWMRRADEITDAMVAVARVKPEWNELVKWYKTKVDRRGDPIEH